MFRGLEQMISDIAPANSMLPPSPHHSSNEISSEVSPSPSCPSLFVIPSTWCPLASSARSQRSPQERTRCNAGLELCARRVSLFFRSNLSGMVDLNEAARELEVKKRRIYDVTNMLEGAGLVERTSKNTMQWRSTVNRDPPDECVNLHIDLADLKA